MVSFPLQAKSLSQGSRAGAGGAGAEMMVSCSLSDTLALGAEYSLWGAVVRATSRQWSS